MIEPTEQQRREMLQTAAQTPLTGLDPGFSGRFFSDLSAMQGFNNSNALHRQSLAVQAELQTEFYKESGQRLPGWVDSMNANALDVARKTVDTWRTQNPNSKFVLPDNDTLIEMARRRSGEAYRDNAKVVGGSRSFSSSLGGFLGSAAGAMTDPINLLSLAFGPSQAAGTLRTALTVGVITGSSEALIQASTYSGKQEIVPEWGPAQALEQVGAAAVGGAVLGGGIKGLAALWRRAKTGRWPTSVRDAGAIIEREAAIPGAPLDRTPSAEAAHRAGVDQAVLDLFEGRSVSAPAEIAQSATSRTRKVFDADGRAVQVRYELVDADRLVASNRDDLTVNPDFPAELQPRDRTAAKSQDQINEMVSKFEPERLGPSPQADSGPPIVGPDNVVESGNGRVLALRRILREGGEKADRYRAFLRAEGFDPDGMTAPVMIGRRMSQLTNEERARFTVGANGPTAARLGATEQARADARLLDDALLAKIEAAENRITDPTVTRDFLSRLPAADRNNLIASNGLLSQQGVDRITGALVARAYDEPAILGRVLEDKDSNIKSLGTALVDAAPAWATMRDAAARGRIPRGMDVTKDLMDAIGIVMRARDTGRKVRELLNNEDAFANPNVRILARTFYSEDASRPLSQQKVADFLRTFAEEAKKNTTGARMFGDPLDADAILEASLKAAGRNDIAAIMAERLTAGRADELAVDPKTADATVESARKLIDPKPRVRPGEDGELVPAPAEPVPGPLVDVGDGRGERPLAEVMKEADDDLAAAADLEACALGVAKDVAE